MKIEFPETSVSLIGLFIIALSLLLAFYAAYIRIRQTTYTEKRFNFVALWSCTSLITAAAILTNNDLKQIILQPLGVEITFADTNDLYMWAIIGIYVFCVSRWARDWNGLRSASAPSIRPSILHFIHDGASETIRIITRRPPSPISRLSPDHGSTNLQLPQPIDTLAFHEQVREIALTRWPHFIIGDNKWIPDARCWICTDVSLDQTVIIACETSPTELPFDRLQTQIRHCANKGPIRLIVVFETSRPPYHQSIQPFWFRRPKCSPFLIS